MTPTALDACRFLIARVQARAGRRWRQGLRKQPLDCASEDAAARIIADRRLCGVPEAAAHALSGWVAGRRPAIGLDHAPTPRQLLAWAADGARPVSLLQDSNGLEFLLHDLCHLEKFVDPAHHQGQVGLFRLLDRVIDGDAWAQMESGLDETWRCHRDHVVADMNGSPVYLFLVLEARLAEACLRCGFPSEDRLGQLSALLGIRGRDRAALAGYFSSISG